MIAAKRTPGGRIRLSLPGYALVASARGYRTDTMEVDITPQTAEKLIAQIKEALEGNVVRVRPMNEPNSRVYTYCDPSATLKVGDLVEVPFGIRNTALLGHVVGLGRDGYDGPLKDVTSKLAKTPLAQEPPF